MSHIQAAIQHVQKRAELQPGQWKQTKEWATGLKVATMNVNSKGTMMRILAEKAAKKEYDVILI